MPPQDPTDDRTNDPYDELLDEDIDYVRPPNRQARIAAFAVIAVFLAIIPIAWIGSQREAKGDPGNLSEDLYTLPANLAPLQTTDATHEWGLAAWTNTSKSHLSACSSCIGATL